MMILPARPYRRKTSTCNHLLPENVNTCHSAKMMTNYSSDSVPNTVWPTCVITVV